MESLGVMWHYVSISEPEPEKQWAEGFGNTCQELADVVMTPLGQL